MNSLALVKLLYVDSGVQVHSKKASEEGQAAGWTTGLNGPDIEWLNRVTIYLATPRRLSPTFIPELFGLLDYRGRRLVAP